MSSKPALQPAAIELTRYYRHYRHPCRSCRPHASSGGDMHRKRSNRRSIWFIKTPNHQPQSFGDFAHGHYTAVVHQVSLLLLLLQEQGDFLLASTPTGDEEPYDMRETLRSLATWKKHKLCLLSIHRRNRKDRQAYSLLLQTTMEPLPHGLLVLSSSKPLTGRTGHQLRDASAPGTTGDTAFTGLSPTITGQGLVSPTTCLVGTHPLRLPFLLLQEQRQADRKLVARNQPCRRQTPSHRAPP